MSRGAHSSPIRGFVAQDAIDFNFTEFPYLPYMALKALKLNVNEFTGCHYRVRLFPLKCGKELDGSPGYYVMGYALHDEDESFSRIVIGDIPSLVNWSDLYDSTHGFLVTFQYVGYSDIYKKVYGIYVGHEITPDDFDQYSQ